MKYYEKRKKRKNMAYLMVEIDLNSQKGKSMETFRTQVKHMVAYLERDFFQHIQRKPDGTYCLTKRR